MSRLQVLVSTADKKLDRVQQRCEHNFDARVRRQRSDIKKSVYKFLRKKYFSRKSPRPKLAPVADGPYEMIDTDKKTVTIKIGKQHERFSRDRVVWAPPLATAPHDVGVPDVVEHPRSEKEPSLVETQVKLFSPFPTA